MKYIFELWQNNGIKENGFCNSIQEIKRKYNTKGFKYFSLFNAMYNNTTDIKGLIIWAGENGFWYNCIHENEFLPKRFCTIKDSEKAEIMKKYKKDPFEA